MNGLTISEKVEMLSRRRARALPTLAVIFLAQQASYFNMPAQSDRTVDHVKIGAWLLLSVVLLAGLGTGGAWFRPREVRELVNDESTRAHRQAGPDAPAHESKERIGLADGRAPRRELPLRMGEQALAHEHVHDAHAQRSGPARSTR